MTSLKTIAIASLLGLGACTQAQVQTQLTTPAGQLFCAVETTSGPQIVALADKAGGEAVIATGVAQSIVNADCAAATASIAGATGPATPISPPASTADVKAVQVTPVS